MYPENNSSNSQTASLSGVLFNHRRYAPWYDDRADYNTDAKSYYDYLARNNKLMDAIIDLINDLSKKVENIPDYTTDEIVYTVGDKGDFKSQSLAFAHIDELAVKPKKITIILLADYINNEQLIFKNKDYHYVNIISNNDTVLTGSMPKDSLVINNGSTNKIAYKPYYYGENTYMPVISYKLANRDKNDKLLVGFGLHNSNLSFNKQAGASDFTFMGMYASHGSNISADYCDFSNNGNRDIQREDTKDQEFYGRGITLESSHISAQHLTINRNGEMGIYMSSGSTGDVRYLSANENGHHGLIATSASSVNASFSQITNTTDDNLVSYAGSSIDFRSGTISGSKIAYGVIATRNSFINLQNTIVKDNAEAGIMSNRSSTIDAVGSTGNNNTIGGIASNNSRLNVTKGTFKNNRIDGVQSTHGSEVLANGANISNNVRKGVLAYAGNFHGQEMTIDSNGERGIESTRGGIVYAGYSTISNNGEDGVLAYTGKINVTNSKLINNEKSAIESTRGGEVIANEATIEGTGYMGVLAYGASAWCDYISIKGTGAAPITSSHGARVTVNNSNIEYVGNILNVGNGGIINSIDTQHKANVDRNTITKKGLIIG